MSGDWLYSRRRHENEFDLLVDFGKHADKLEANLNHPWGIRDDRPVDKRLKPRLLSLVIILLDFWRLLVSPPKLTGGQTFKRRPMI